MIKPVSFLLSFGFFIYIGIQFCHAKEKKSIYPQSVDLPYIACDVCTLSVKEIIAATSKLRESAPYKKLTELQVSEVIDGICKPEDENDYGLWIRSFDIVTKSDGKSLALKKMDGYSKCDVECLTIAKSCDNLYNEEIDIDDLSALLWGNKYSSETVIAKVCTKWSNRCSKSKKSPKHSIDRVDYEFKEISEKDLEMEKLMAKMKASGMGGMSMYNRDDMESMMAGGGMDPYGDEEDSYGDGYMDHEVGDQHPSKSSMEF